MKYILIVVLLLNVLLVSAQMPGEKVPAPGEMAPEFGAYSENKEFVELSNLFKKGKVILIFYRGAWCPYCNRHMSNLQDSLELILQKGASLVAVSPESGESIASTKKKTRATFSIIYDSAYVIMKKYGVAFKVSDSTVRKYKLMGIHLENANKNDDNILPVPATFIIGTSGKVEFVHYDENYKKRLPVKEILLRL